jgi:hypothetical protein
MTYSIAPQEDVRDIVPQSMYAVISPAMAKAFLSFLTKYWVVWMILLIVRWPCLGSVG